MGKPILKYRYSGGLLGSDREETYEKCKNGVYNESTFKYEGKLSRTEKYFYEKEVLGRNVRFEEIEGRGTGSTRESGGAREFRP